MAIYGEDEFLCFMYYDDFASPWHDIRNDYNLVWAYPSVFFNGQDYSETGEEFTEYVDMFSDWIDGFLAQPSLLRMSVDLSIVGDTGTVNGHIEALDTVPDALIYVAIYEDPGPRQPHVVHWFPVDQVPLTALSSGQTQDVSGTFTVDASWIAQDLHAVMFVQNAFASHGPMILAGLGPHENNGSGIGVNQESWWFTYNYGFINFADFPCYGVEKYGVNPAAGDIDGDMMDEIITGPGPGDVFGPHVRGFEFDGTQLPGVNFFAYDTLKFGANVACGDIDGDGYDEIITGAGPGAVFGPHVRAWDYDDSGAVTSKSDVSYFAYGTPKFGVNVTCGDVDGDGMDEIITGAGPGAVYGPHVRGWNYDGASLSPISGVSFLAYGTNKYGVNVTSGDVDGDGMDEIITGAGPGAVFGPHVRGWDVDGGPATAISGISFFAFDDNTEWGVNVGAGDLDGDGMAEIVAGRGEGPGFNSKVIVFSYDGSDITEGGSYTAFSGSSSRGVNVAVGEFGVEPGD